MKVPLKLNICNVKGECLTVTFPLQLEGSVVEVKIDDVDDLCSAIEAAADQLEAEDDPWSDNFDLAKLRSKNRG